MGKLTKVIVSGISIFIFAGCFSEGPGDIAKKWIESAAEGDVEYIKKHSTASTINLLTLTCKMKNFKQLDSECLKVILPKVDSVKIINVDEKEDATATVVVEEGVNGTYSKESIELTKLNDIWKVNIHK